MYLLRIIFFLFLSQLLFANCERRATTAPKITVSILPLKYIVENITGNDFVVNVLVPPGASPETFEPNPAQMKNIYESGIVFSTGLIDFEQQLTPRLKAGGSRGSNDAPQITEVCAGIELMQGHCGHLPNSNHSHGIDPHIWISPYELQTITDNIYRKINELYPDSVKYTDNYLKLIERLKALDAQIKEMLQEARVDRFVIYHPALTYYARRYGLEQISIEQGGKEPSVRQLRDVIARCKADRVRYIFYQEQFPETVVRTLADDVGATPVPVDPLREDVVDNLIYITKLICRI